MAVSITVRAAQPCLRKCHFDDVVKVTIKPDADVHAGSLGLVDDVGDVVPSDLPEDLHHLPGDPVFSSSRSTQRVQ
jgi:hypothetical protein